MGRKSTGEGKHPKNNIRVLREAMGMTQTKLADLAGMSTSYLSNLESFKSRANVEILEKLGKVLGASSSSIIDVAEKDTVTILVSSSVQADEWFQDFQDIEWPIEDMYEVTMSNFTNYPGVKRYASEVRGHSMNKVFPDGSVIIWVPYEDINEPLIPGKKYVLYRKKNNGLIESTCKTYMRDRDGKEWFYPESTDSRHQNPSEYLSDDGMTETVEVVGRVIMAQVFQ